MLDKTDDSEYGKFGWVMDPEGNTVELWQPPAGKQPSPTRVTAHPRRASAQLQYIDHPPDTFT
ncbi:MAG: VOC family protein, partial [Rubrivivax sp.]